MIEAPLLIRSKIRVEFETWIAGVAKVDSEAGNASSYSPANMERQLSLMFRVARLALISNARVASSVERVTEAMDQMREAQIETQSTTRDFAESLCNMTSSQVLTNKALTAINDNIETREELKQIMDELSHDADKQRDLYESVRGSLEDLSSRQIQLQERAEADQKHFVQRDELKWLMNDTQSKMQAEFTQLNFSVENMNGFLAEIDKNLNSSASDIRLSQDKIVAESQDLREKLSSAIQHSKSAIEEAQKLELEAESDQTIMGIKQRLFSTFPISKGESKETEETTRKPKRSFNPFRRSA